MREQQPDVSPAFSEGNWARWILLADSEALAGEEDAYKSISVRSVYHL